MSSMSSGRKGKRLISAVAVSGLMLSGVLVANLTGAQAPGGGQGRQGRGGGQGQAGQDPNGGPGGFGGRGQGQGGFGGRSPMMSGTVTGGDRSAGTIIISSPFGGGNQTLKVTQSTKYATQNEVAASDLRVGDQVQVQGVPTGITASSITAGQMPDFLRPGGQNNAGGPNNAGGAANGGGPNNANAQGRNAQGANGQGQNGQAQTQAFASATGKVISTSPLTISIGTGVSVVLKMGADAKVTKITQASFDTLKVGDRIMAAGAAGADGTFAATGIGVNMTQGGGPGGRGGFGGPGGFGGGPGGGFGGRGGNGQGGPGGPPPNDGN